MTNMQCGFTKDEDETDLQYFCIREPDHEGNCRNGHGRSWHYLTFAEQISDMIIEAELPDTWELSEPFEIPGIHSVPVPAHTV